MVYQIGHLEYPAPDDPTFEDYWEALVKAQDGSIDDNVWAVWNIEDKGNATIVSIIYGGNEYS